MGQLPSERIRVGVQAADPIGRAGVRSLLRHQGSVEVVEESGAEGCAGVVVMVVDRLDEVVAAELRRISRGLERPVVLVARELREDDLLTVVECGVRAILWRHEATEARLLKAVHRAARGESDLPIDLLNQLLTQVGRLRRCGSEESGTGSVPLLGMAPREVDVLRLIADGLDTRQISQKLAYSERTIKNILHGVMTRLQLSNRAHAVAFALREGYI
ncbi:response regulator transcription factor [Streptomyces clavuligerus]|uniref:Response regulator n=1 Tax=Streptomyces clavuligerus TaxID=1901 RepID=B5GYP1_STRCL|nr:response regulator transcription factor [Streptomyces clavuligerus]ANW22562.1 helix-turn-helix transcriptional regulator [Streptomyces clavuligerus]AXU16961.1 DNA-binding response regulator [Streptomyces clavuligerus]AXU17445.1 DNA-binding response regulator [Streptomyces clavuligerus]EDY51437.1 response regulator [Streptomyces clavuligerus]EFG04689.1 response regulator [Streptomyces clavuligerus]